MSPEVRERKRKMLCRYLERLQRHTEIGPDEYAEARYEVERLLELLLEVAVDVTAHELARKNRDVPETYRKVFDAARESGLLDEPLTVALRNAAGQRNLLVHLYENIQDDLVRKSIPAAISAYSEFLVAMGKWE